MTRAAGDSKTYQLGVIDKLALSKLIEEFTEAIKTEEVRQRFSVRPEDLVRLSHEFPSVTTITKLLDKSGPFVGSAWNVMADGVSALSKMPQVVIKDWSPDMVKGFLKAEGFTPWKRRDSAAERGTSVHQFLEELASGREAEAARVYDEATAEEQFFMSGVRAWWDNERPDPTHVEVPVVSFQHRFAGTVDLGARRWRGPESDVPRLHTLTDLKTSKAIFEDHFIQICGYDIGFEENGLLFDRLSILRATPDGDYEEVFLTEQQRVRYRQAFLGLRAVYGALIECGEEQ